MMMKHMMLRDVKSGQSSRACMACVEGRAFVLNAFAIVVALARAVSLGSMLVNSSVLGIDTAPSARISLDVAFAIWMV